MLSPKVLSPKVRLYLINHMQVVGMEEVEVAVEHMVVQELDIFSCSDVRQQVVEAVLVELVVLEDLRVLEDLAYLDHQVLLEDLVVLLVLGLLDLLLVPSFREDPGDLALEVVVVEVVGVEGVEERVVRVVRVVHQVERPMMVKL